MYVRMERERIRAIPSKGTDLPGLVLAVFLEVALDVGIFLLVGKPSGKLLLVLLLEKILFDIFLDFIEGLAWEESLVVVEEFLNFIISHFDFENFLGELLH